jgi:hypothetical protein
MRDWIAYQLNAKKLGRSPTATEFGKKLGVDRHRGRDRLRRLVSLEANGGPWFDRKRPTSATPEVPHG